MPGRSRAVAVGGLRFDMHTREPRLLMMQVARIGRRLLTVALSAAGIASGAGEAVALEPVGSDFRISKVGSDGITNSFAADPALAYNATAGEYLVVWQQVDGEREIFGQRVDAAGAAVGPAFRISNVGADGDLNRSANTPAVAYNPTANEYLVTWHGDGLATNDENEIFGQRLSASGAELGGDFRISNAGSDGDVDRSAANGIAAYNPLANEYLVVWQADGLATDEEDEIFGQRLSAAGVALGGGDFRISNVGADGDATRDAFANAIAFNPLVNEYLVAWRGDQIANDEFEVYAQRLSGAGAAVGTDFRVSNAGTDGDPDRDASTPVIGFAPSVNQYLVAFRADGLATDDEDEIFGQRLSASGAELGGDFRISNVGADGDAERAAIEPAIAPGSNPDEYLVVWQGDGLATDDEDEVFGQRVSLAGAEIGGDMRISNVGADGDAGRGAVRPAVAFDSTTSQYLTVWSGDGLATNDEFEIFGRLLATPPVDSTAPETTIDKGPKKRTKKRKAKLVFSSNEPGSTFECRLDKKPYKPCDSPYKRRVKRGKHSFEVRAVDAAGNVDATPAKRSWKVKRKKG